MFRSINTQNLNLICSYSLQLIIFIEPAENFSTCHYIELSSALKKQIVLQMLLIIYCYYNCCLAKAASLVDQRMHV